VLEDSSVGHVGPGSRSSRTVERQAGHEERSSGARAQEFGQVELGVLVKIWRSAQ
jgi:hypothetical protein